MKIRHPAYGGISPGIVLGLLVVAFAAVGLIRFFLTNNGGPQRGYPPTPVQLTQLRDEPFARRVTLLGEARSMSDATIRSEVEGVISQVLVDVGDDLEAGQVVAYLEGSDQQIALAEAEARLAEGRSRLSELENGTRPEIVSQRLAEWRAAQAFEAEAKARLDSLKLLSPQLLAQRTGEFQSAVATERDAQDQFKRTQGLVEQGALPERELISVGAAWERAKGDLLRAEQSLLAQQTSNQRDDLTAIAQYESAKAQSLRSQASYDEARTGPRPEVIEAQRGVVQALQAARDRAALNYERTTIRSRTVGTVRERLVGRGDRVSVDTAVLTLGGEQTELIFEIPEEITGRVEPGMDVLLLSAGAREEAVGKVVAVVRAADPRSRRQTIRVNSPVELLSGSSVQGVLLLPVDGDYLVVSRDALVRRERSWVVFTVDSEGQAVEHEVRLVAEQGLEVAIETDDLVGGQNVVGRGAPGLMTGAKVALPQSADDEGQAPRDSGEDGEASKGEELSTS